MRQLVMAGASAIDANRRAMTGSGADLANLNTNGYQGSRTLFKDMLYSTMQPASRPSGNVGGRNAIQFGAGTTLSATDVDTSAGNAVLTGRKGDVAITGDGYLMISDGTSISYTRDGAFDLDGANRLVHKSTGQLLVGWKADDNGNIDPNAEITPTSYITVPKGAASSAAQTSLMEMAGNLRNSRNDPAADQNGENGTTFVASGFVNNAVGSSMEIQYEFTKVVATDAEIGEGTTIKWDWLARRRGVEGDEGIIGRSGENGNEQLLFGNDGKLKNPESLGTIQIPGLPDDAGTNNLPFEVKVNFKNMGSTDDDANVYMLSQNGNNAELLNDYSIDQTGMITGIFGSQTKPLAQMALAAFTNPAGLERVGNNTLVKSGNSGEPQIGIAGTGSRSTLRPGSLEQSNVDATKAIIDLNMYSRSAQYGMMAIRTGNEVEDRLINTIS